jgi:HSP20 family protein
VPQTIDQAGIQASLKNGVLELKLPKKPEAKPRQIQVTVG